MKRLLSILRYVFVSLEFLVCAAGIALYVFLPGQFIWISERIGSQAELLKYFGLLPIGLVVYDSTVSKNILMPDADKRNAFQRWELYGDFKCGCIVGLGYAVLFGFAGIGCFFFDWKSPAAHQAALLLTSITGALTVSATLYFAHIKVEELFRQHSNPSP